MKLSSSDLKKQPSEAKVKYYTLEEVVNKYEEQIKQLQDRIKQLEFAPEYVKGHADGYVDGYAQAKNELQMKR